MDQPTERSPSTREIRRLTFALWALVLALLLNAGVTLSVSLSSVSAHRVTEAPPDTVSTLDHPFVDEYAGFHEWPLKKQIEVASAIVLTTYKVEDGKLKSVISEILKQQPGVTFHYQIGDEDVRGSRHIEENTFYGDGEVILFTGSPPMMRYSASYSHGRVGAMGDVPLQTLREMIAKEK